MSWRLDLPLSVTRIAAPNSVIPPNEAARSALRAKTIATRLTPEELQKVEAAVEGTMAHLFSPS